MRAEWSVLRQRLVGDGLWAALGTMITLASSFLIAILLSRLLSPAELGRYFLLLSGATILATFGQLGLGPVALRRLAAASGSETSAERQAALRDTVAAAMLGSLFLLSIGPLLARILTPGGWSIIVFTVWVLALGWQALHGEMLRGLGAFGPAALYGGAGASLSFAAVLGIAMLSRRDLNLETTLMLVAGTTTLAALAGAVFLYRWFWQPAWPALPPRPLAALAEAWPMLGTHMNWLLIGQADIWIVALVCSPVEVAVYGLATRVARLLTLPQEVTKAVLAPRLAALYRANRRGDMERLVRGAATLAALPIALVTLLLLPAGALMLESLFGPVYRAGTVPLLALAWGQTVGVAAGLAATTLTMAGYPRIVLWSSALGTFVTLLLTLLVAQTANLNMIAIAVACGIGFRNVLALVAARRHIGIWTHAWPLPPYSKHGI